MLTRGDDAVNLQVESGADTVVVTVTGSDWSEKVELNGSLLPISSE